MAPDLGSLLIVDDDEDNRDMLCLRLAREGYTTSSAENGSQAIELVAKQTFDLVLLDITMPDIDGLTVLKTLRQTYSAAELPIIMATGKHESEDVVAALKLGANDYVTKPIDLPVVLARIGAQVARKQEEKTLRESEERYALAARGANEGLWDWNLDTNEVYYSSRWKAMLGCEESEVHNKPDEWFTRVHPDDLPRLRGELAAHLEGRSDQFESEHRMLHENGTYCWMLARGLVARNADGDAYRMAGSLTDITESKLADTLTGLPNRLLFLDRLERAVERIKRHPDNLFAVLFLDLDRFKVVNDSLGHTVGDQLLSALGQRLEACLRSGDTVTHLVEGRTIARLGGDEFAILLEDLKHPSDATRVAERIHTALTLPFTLDGHEVFTTASIGIALSTTAYGQPEDLLRDADTAMYRAKAGGTARSEIFDTAMHDTAVARLTLETDLRWAVEHREFRVYYQAIVSLKTGRISGFEALVRWQHPQRGLVFPTEFIAVAEETGLIIPLGEYVLREACRQIRVWQTQFPADPPLLISVNLSGKQFVQSHLIEQIACLLREIGLAADTVKLEITESVLMDNDETAADMVKQLHALGTQLGLDDFGTGYSSLSYLHLFPFDTLKIDRSFISRIGVDGENTEIVRTIVTLAHDLGMQVIAEGVETPAHLAHLRALGCEYGQGYLFSKPVDGETAEALLVAEPQW